MQRMSCNPDEPAKYIIDKRVKECRMQLAMSAYFCKFSDYKNKQLSELLSAVIWHYGTQQVSESCILLYKTESTSKTTSSTTSDKQ